MAHPLTVSDVTASQQKPSSVRSGEPGARGRPAFEPGAFEHIFERLVEDAVLRGATDIHMRAGDVVQARIHGALVALDTPALMTADTPALAALVLDANGSAERIEDVKEFEGSWSLRGVGRFRVNILRQRS